MRKVSNLQSLIALETTARLESLSEAAKEICVTQSAISHRLKKLEQEMGVTLLERNSRKVELTEYGKKIVNYIRPILDQLDDYHQFAQSIAGNRRIKIGVSSALYSFWLGARIAKFREECGASDVEVVTLWSLEQVNTLQPNIAILPVPANTALDPKVEFELFRDEIFPVCRADVDVGDANATLIELSRKSAQSGSLGGDTDSELEWANWFVRVGDDFGLKSLPAYRYDSVALAMSAIVHGSGIGLGRTLLTVDHLCDGTLIRPLPQEASILSPMIHAVRRLTPSGQSKDVDMFVEWLVAEIDSSLRAFNTLPARLAEAAPGSLSNR